VGEGTHTNVFAVVDDTLVTPPIDVDPPILHGVTRAMVAEVAEDAAIPFAERPLPVHELLEAEEVLITSSRKIVAAIVQIDGRPVGSGAIGPVARSVYDRCLQRIANECGIATSPTTGRIAAGAAAEPRA
ncbi:MAG: aminotransferase class IV, partial [Phycisphaerales bacterium]|nr:aminotransferase class IV [Phycisphaerales bacterium]